MSTLEIAQDVLYRYEAKRYSYIIDADLDLYGTTQPSLSLDKYRVLKRTPKGAWIEYRGSEKFVLLSAANKRFACETETEALESFKARKLRQIRILNGQLKRAKEDLDLAAPDLTPV